VNFWRVLRDPEQFEQLHRLITLTPYSRQEFKECDATWDQSDDAVERARRWYVMVRQAFSAHDVGSLGWSYCRSEDARGMSKSVSKWLTNLELLPAIHARWMRVQIENDDFRAILERYDTPATLFYLDPPYVPATRKRGGYRHELTLGDHEDLVRYLLRLQGMAILSGYAHPVYDALEDAGWTRLDIPTTCKATGRTRATGLLGDGALKHSAKHQRIESVWISPTAQHQRQLTLGDLGEAES
jgi:DNA adenine methylase